MPANADLLEACQIGADLAVHGVDCEVVMRHAGLLRLCGICDGLLRY
jgi:hypothetical protein